MRRTKVSNNISTSSKDTATKSSDASKATLKTTETNKNNSKQVKSSSKPLSSVICFVETVSKDGIDASASYHPTLKSLGATVSESFGDHLTHYICTETASTERRIKASMALGISVVSPLWVEQCSECKMIVPEEDFSLIHDPNQKHSSSKSSSLSMVNPSSSEPERPGNDSYEKRAVATISKANRPISSKSKPNITQPSPSERSVISTDEDEPAVKLTKPVNARLLPNPAGPVIPLPSFKPYVPPPILKSQTRRSERIMDIYDESQSEDEYEAVPEDDLSHIDPNTPLLVFSDANLVDESNDSTTASKKGKVTSNKAKVGQTKKSSESSARDSYSTKTSTSSTSTDAATLIAVTGFDDTTGEKTTLTALITAIIKIIGDKGQSVGRLLGSNEDPLCGRCTIIVAADSSRRTQRMLLGLVKGIPIVTIQWVYACLEASDWVSTASFLHPINAHRKDSPSKLFKAETFLIGASFDISPDILVTMVENTGARVTEDINKASALLFGCQDDADVWMDSLDDTAASTNIKKKAMTFAMDSKAYSCKV